MPYERLQDAANAQLGGATPAHDVLAPGARENAPDGAAYGGRVPLDVAHGDGRILSTDEARRVLLLEKLEAERRANGGDTRVFRAVSMPSPKEEVTSARAPPLTLTSTQGSSPSYPGTTLSKDLQIPVGDDSSRAEARARMRALLAAERMQAEVNAREEMLRAALRSRV